MKIPMNISKILRFSLMAALVTGFSTLAHAQATRTWVSGVGDDANPCSRTAPCKTFAGAISKTANCGEISVLDPGGFGGVTITKSITISSTFEGGVLVLGGNGIIVNAGPADKVILKGLDIEGINGQAITGIRYIGGGHLLVEDCTINGFGTAGIVVDFTTQPSGTNAALNVKNLRISNTPVGIRLNNTVGGFITALINDLQAINLGTFGLQTQTNAFATITNSRFDHNGSALQAEFATATSNVIADNTPVSGSAGYAMMQGWNASLGGAYYPTGSFGPTDLIDQNNAAALNAYIQVVVLPAAIEFGIGPAIGAIAVGATSAAAVAGARASAANARPRKRPPPRIRNLIPPCSAAGYVRATLFAHSRARENRRAP